MSDFPRARAGALTLALHCGLGCQSTLYSKTGDIMTGYTVDHVLPTLMQSGDVQLACSTGLAFAAFLSSFERVTKDTARANLVSYVSAAFCAEAAAREAELAQLRALRSAAAGQAQDARIVEKRQHRVAAERFLTAYQQWERVFGTPKSSCPALQAEEQPLYLLGLAAGLNAVLHDRAAGGRTDVPLEIPGLVARATDCLNSERWFGIPQALQGAVWAGIPGLAPPETDITALLSNASELGEARGVRLARALEVQAWGSAGRNFDQRQALQALAASLEKRPSDPQWELFDAMGTLIALHESDKIWTQQTGHRTPAGKLGTFFSVDAPAAVDDGLLDDLDGEAPPPSSENPS